MKARTMILSAVICTASLLGLNVAAVYAEPLTYDIVSEVEDAGEFQPLSQAVRDRNNAILAGVLGAAIATSFNNSGNHSYDRPPQNSRYNERSYNDDYRQSRRDTPPPPPMPSHRR